MADGTPIIIKKKKAHGHGGHHGGSWKVAYADFVTAMMAFFMVMWIMGLSDQTRAQIQGYFNDPLGFTKNEPKAKVNISPPGEQYARVGRSQSAGAHDARKEMREAESVKEQIEEELRDPESGLEGLKRDVEIAVTDEGLELQFIERDKAFFAVGSAVLTPNARKLISRIAPILANTERPLMIDGHTDSRPYPGTGYDNWDLSGDRAHAMRRALMAGGVQQKQIVSVRGNADRKLKVPEDPLNPTNRRVIVLLPFASEEENSPSGPNLRPDFMGSSFGKVR